MVAGLLVPGSPSSQNSRADRQTSLLPGAAIAAKDRRGRKIAADLSATIDLLFDNFFVIIDRDEARPRVSF